MRNGIAASTARPWSARILALCCARPAAGPAACTRRRGRMHFDVAAIPANEAYKLLVSTVVPRPIALATTVDLRGRCGPGRAVRGLAAAGLLAFCGMLTAAPAIAFDPPFGNKNFT